MSICSWSTDGIIRSRLINILVVFSMIVNTTLSAWMNEQKGVITSGYITL